MSRYIEAPASVTKKQIERAMKNIHIYKERKREVAINKAIIALVIILWIFCLCVVGIVKAKPTEEKDTYQGTYIVQGYIEYETINGYVVYANDKPHTYETDRYFPEGKMVSVYMDRNGTKEIGDDFIANIY